MKKELQLNESLAALGHGKWKRALGCTLLMIGLLMGEMNAWGQNGSHPAPDGLMMRKTFTKTNEDGSEGIITLQTFVTGESVQISAGVPSDIVLVLDQSGSMNQPISGSGQGSWSTGSNESRMHALCTAVQSFIDIIYQDAQKGYDHKIAVVGFSSNAKTKLLTTEDVVYYDGGDTGSGTTLNISDEDYQDALVLVNNNGSLNTRLNETNLTGQSGRINNTNQGTYMQYGLELAYNVLDKRTVKTFEVEGQTFQRAQVVVFFTDGYPGSGNSAQNNHRFYYPEDGYSTNVDQAPEADAAVVRARNLKNAGATVWSVCVISDADENAMYKTSDNGSGHVTVSRVDYYFSKSYGGVSGSGTHAPVDGLMHMISSNYAGEGFEDFLASTSTTPWQDETVKDDNVANRFSNSKYKATTDASELSGIFSSIAQQSGGSNFDLGVNTVISDVVSTSFKLPDGASTEISVYLPKLLSINDTGDEEPTFDDYNFEALQNGSLSIENGIVVTGGSENKVVNTSDHTYYSIGGDDNKTVDLSGINLGAMYCGHINGEISGRKLVIQFPVVVEDGVWGDGIVTNGPMSLIKDGTSVIAEFDAPVTNVLGDVWTEIVTSRPDGFPTVTDDGSEQTVEIDSPEDLAWFISEVNGRIYYDENNNVASHPKLNGKLMADIDMSAHNWVPIGAGYQCNDNNEYVDANGEVSYLRDENGELVLDDEGQPINVPAVKLAYDGDFDGNGYVITGLKNNASKFYKQATTGGNNQVVVFPGMFANVTGTVHDVFVLDADFRGKHHSDGFVHHGIIADTLMGGTIYNCEAVGSITCSNEIEKYTNPETGEETNYRPDMNLVFGGLVGLNDGGSIYNSMAMATLEGYCMGGAVGEMYNSTLANSFTNGVYKYLGDAETNDPTGADQQQLYRYVGGLVGRNHHFKMDGENSSIKAGAIENCYVRFSRSTENSLGDESTEYCAKFGQLVGSNTNTFTMGATQYSATGTITNCYSLVGNDYYWVNDQATTPVNTYTLVSNPSHMRRDRSSDNMTGGTYNASTGIYENGVPLVDKLNANRGNNATWAEWKRTTAGGYTSSINGGNINGDYPVLKLTGYKCVASTNGIALDYAKDLDQMLERHNNGEMNSETALPGEGSGYYTTTGTYDYHVSQTNHKTQSDFIYGGAINLYANDNTSKGTSTTAGTMVYIDENVSLLQSTSAAIDAFTGQTMKSFSDPDYDPNTGTWAQGDPNLYQPDKQRWHLVSSSLQDSKFGWTYAKDEGEHWTDYTNIQVAHSQEENPCYFWIGNTDGSQANEDQTLFPLDCQSYKPVDFYCFFEPQYHWINFKRNGKSHWHMDLSNDAGSYDDPSNHAYIDYYYNDGTEKVHDNETQFVKGKGYLLAVYPQFFEDLHKWDDENSVSSKKNEQFLQNRGTLNNGPITIPVTYTAANEWTKLAGYNLLGNPYQSYLDFDEFVRINTTGDNPLWNVSDTYAKTYAVYNPETDSYEQYKSNSSKGSRAAGQYINMHQGFFIQTSQNTTAHFTNDMRSNDGTPNFRGEQPAYPLINFTVTDYEGETDLAVLELNRPENDGAKKLRMGSPAGRIYFRYDNTNLAIYFRNSDKDYQTLNFSAEEDGNFTLSWNMANADFSSLTLVDNITGIKTDMLTHDHYTFEGRMDDYNTRFKIVFGEMDTNDEEEPVLEHFAFFDHGNLIVNGTGHFEVVDVMGRVLYAVELTDTQNTVSLPSNVRGVCMLCFTRNNETKVQKMVIQ